MAARTKFTARKRRKFIAKLKQTGNISGSAAAISISRRLAYNIREQNPKFARQWDEAVEYAADALEQEARRRAVDGVKQPVFYKGRRVASVRQYSDGLLTTLLKGNKPEKFADRKHLTGDVSIKGILSDIDGNTAGVPGD